jgi:hypothetical protein
MKLIAIPPSILVVFSAMLLGAIQRPNYNFVISCLFFMAVIGAVTTAYLIEKAYARQGGIKYTDASGYMILIASASIGVGVVMDNLFHEVSSISGQDIVIYLSIAIGLTISAGLAAIYSRIGK